jgi:hypothetical protein
MGFVSQEHKVFFAITVKAGVYRPGKRLLDKTQVFQVPLDKDLYLALFTEQEFHK